MKFIVEISSCGSVSVCKLNGDEISKRSKLASDLRDCTKSGDCEDACRFVLSHHNAEFRTVKVIDDEYQNVIASSEDKMKVCKTIYFESESDFSNESTADMYLIWEAASQFIQE